MLESTPRLRVDEWTDLRFTRAGVFTASVGRTAATGADEEASAENNATPQRPQSLPLNLPSFLLDF